MRRFRTATSRGDDRGAVAVEFALVVPLLVLFVFGMIELSLLLRDYVSTSSAVRTGARMASANAGAGPGTCPTGPSAPPCTPANAPAFAQAAADAIQRAGSAMPKDSIDEIWIYKANNLGFPGSNGSTSMVCGANCVVYKWNAAADRFYYSSGSWASSSVNACLNTSDAVGVFLKATHKYVTGFAFPGRSGPTVTVSDRAVMRFEPLDTQSCAPGNHL